MKTLLLVLPLVLVALAASCFTPDPTGALSMEVLARDWVVQEVGGRRVAGTESPPTLRFEPNGKFSGFSGVNRFNGRLDTKALVQGQFDMGPFVSTRMAGTPQAMELERQLFDSLESADSCDMRDASLILFHEGEIVVRLSPAGH